MTSTPAEFTVAVTLGETTSARAFTNRPTSFGAAASRVVNRSAALRLSVFGDDVSEQYRIRRIDVTIQDRASRGWVGSGDTSWATVANWSPAGAPSAVDDLRFEPGAGASVVDEAYTVRSLTMPSSYGALVRADAALTVRYDAVITSGTLEVGAGSLAVTGAISVNGGTLKGSVSGPGGPVTLTAGGTLKGSIAVGRAVVVGAGGRISPGE